MRFLFSESKFGALGVMEKSMVSLGTVVNDKLRMWSNNRLYFLFNNKLEALYRNLDVFLSNKLLLKCSALAKLSST